MRNHVFLAAVCLIGVAGTALAANRGASKPATRPSSTTKPADAAGQGPTESLAGGQVTFVAPGAGWVKSDASSRENRAVYVTDSGEGILSIEVTPDMEITPGVAGTIVKDLRARRKKDNVTVEEAKIEKDPRFGIRIRERFNRGERVADQLHLYKYVGPRVVMVTVNSVADDEAEAKKIHAAGEQALLSAKYVKPAGKAMPRKGRGTGGQRSRGR